MAKRQVKVFTADITIYPGVDPQGQDPSPSQRAAQQDLIMRLLDELDSREDVLDAEINGNIVEGPIHVELIVPNVLTESKAAKVATAALNESIKAVGGQTFGFPNEAELDAQFGTVATAGQFRMGEATGRRELIDA
jgi:hypothetical protein